KATRAWPGTTKVLAPASKVQVTPATRPKVSCKLADQD
ncbi:hypothetical protein A2U01_0092327, partial [Trifolium medium]|nr:hypothetical protein [Trifolium medium]